MKPGRNALCPCGSGTKYKFCCIGADVRQRIVTIDSTSPLYSSAGSVDLTDDIMNRMSGMDRTLHHFCKDNDSYFFGTILTVRQVLDFSDELREGSLTMAALFDAYTKQAREEPVTALIASACESFSSFKQRKDILLSAIAAHYRDEFSLSVPVFLAQIEGILRDIGTLAPKDSLKPSIKRDWDSRTLFGMSDSAAMFNAFLHRLYSGQARDGSFNRNPILHGTDTSYGTRENSLTLILTLLEIRNFLWFEKNTAPLF